MTMTNKKTTTIIAIINNTNSNNNSNNNNNNNHKNNNNHNNNSKNEAYILSCHTGFKGLCSLNRWQLFILKRCRFKTLAPILPKKHRKITRNGSSTLSPANRRLVASVNCRFKYKSVWQMLLSTCRARWVDRSHLWPRFARRRWGRKCRRSRNELPGLVYLYFFSNVMFYFHLFSTL